jgi:hypothetical protein
MRKKILTDAAAWCAGHQLLWQALQSADIVSKPNCDLSHTLDTTQNVQQAPWGRLLPHPLTSGAYTHTPSRNTVHNHNASAATTFTPGTQQSPWDRSWRVQSTQSKQTSSKPLENYLHDHAQSHLFRKVAAQIDACGTLEMCRMAK